MPIAQIHPMNYLKKVSDFCGVLRPRVDIRKLISFSLTAETIFKCLSSQVYFGLVKCSKVRSEPTRAELLEERLDTYKHCGLYVPFVSEELKTSFIRSTPELLVKLYNDSQTDLEKNIIVVLIKILGFCFKASYWDS